MRPQFRSVIRELGGALGRLGYGSVTTIRPVPAWGTSTSSAAVDSSKTSAAPRSVVNGSRRIPRQAPPKTGPQIPPRGCVGFNIWACLVVPQLRNRRRLGKGCDPIGLYASGLANRTDPGVWQPPPKSNCQPHSGNRRRCVLHNRARSAICAIGPTRT